MSKYNTMTELFPILAGIHRRTQISLFYWRMKHDANIYAQMHQKDNLPAELYRSAVVIDESNDNLQCSAAMIDGMIIRPYETFSLFQAVRRIGNCVPRTEGIVSPSDQDMSQLASILFQAFLHTPLTVTERHSRDEIDRFSKDSEAIRGIETEAQEGTMDLKIRNDTPDAFQIRLNHENNHLNCSIFSSCDNGYRYRITNCNLAYIHDESGITEQVDVIQERYQKNHPNSACRKVLYRNSSRLLCDIPEGAIVLQRGSF